MREIPEELRHGPFTISRAAELGLTPRVLDGSRFRAPWPGVRVLRDSPDTVLERCRAVGLVLPPSAVFTHGTALHLGGWLTPRNERGQTLYPAREPSTTTPLHVSVPPLVPRPRGRGLVSHRWDPGPDDVIQVDGVAISSPWRTWCDLAAGGTAHTDLVILADAIRRHLGAKRLGDRLAAWGARRGSRALHAALASSRDGVDSPMETRMRLLIADAGLPEPSVNQWIVDDVGAPIHKADLSWPQWRVAVDYDGVHHQRRDGEAEVREGRASDWRQRQDQSRRDLLTDLGWVFRVLTSFDIFRRPELAMEGLRMTLRRAGAPV